MREGGVGSSPLKPGLVCERDTKAVEDSMPLGRGGCWATGGFDGGRVAGRLEIAKEARGVALRRAAVREGGPDEEARKVHEAARDGTGLPIA